VIIEDKSENIRDCVINAVESGADLSRANLSRADLSRANLCGANLCGADLSRADLCGANLCGANLCGADLSRANLCGANLCVADLSRANLSRANLSRADLSRANLSRADLSRAIGLKFKPIQIQGSRHWIIRTTNNRVAIGCHEYTITQWLKTFRKIGADNNYSSSEIEEYGIYLKCIHDIMTLEKEQINE